MVLKKTLESPLGCKENQPVHPKGNQSGQSSIFIGRTDDEAEALILWPLDEKNWLIGKDSDVGKNWTQEEKGMTEEKMVGWHHQFDGCEFEQTPGVGDGQGSLVCCSPGGYKEPEMTEWVNWTYLTLYTKVKVLNTRPETIKLLKENRGKDFMILEYAYNTSNVFLDVTRNA